MTKAKIVKLRASIESQVQKLDPEPQGTKDYITWRINRERLMAKLQVIEQILS